MQLVWFMINIFFVGSLIVMLFVQRSFTDARQQGGAPERIQRLNMLRKTMFALTILLFVAMSASFLANMRLNG
ncbi:hypothetical protein ACFOQM_23895 [Paenibacillus sp. GCM10012307]|uniref:Uncharacterized protein n=1 Tax=Paenibacillus roseus TaxID=2798579 RepID=A0A934JBZ4_9BACL|nr:hypothetical protein [Paenibacillus roseus]MBJ6364267.1 hypothetical protein [Paenibacillus roseus]